jgi:SSS family solute:Na+ symporter
LSLSLVDYGILALYLCFILGIGWKLRHSVTSAGEFLTAGHHVPVWITSLAFLAANLGAQEVVGMMASGAKYGIMTAHFYWVGAAPAMIFAGIFMMPFYYGSKARSVPEYLKLRFDEKTRALNALTFAVMTLFSSGISMYALGRMFQLVLGWSFHASVLLSAVMVLAYTLLGGLTSAIYNEVLQFFLIVAGFTPLSIVVIARAGGWSGIQARLPGAMTHAWRYMGSPAENPMGIETFGMVAGLGFVLSFGYWCTDFLVIQRALAANSMSAARRTPLIAAFPKMLMPFIVILPGVAALALTKAASGYSLPVKGNSYDYDQTLTTLMAQFYPTGMLGVGLTALMASFMSGMAGNVTAFNTVFTFDLYQGHINKDASDQHYLKVGRWTTVVGVALSIGTAYLALQFNNMLDFLQLVFSFVNPPLFATFLLGMFWKRATADGAFAGLLCGTIGAGLTEALTMAEGKGGWIAVVHTFPSQMAQNFWISIVSWTICLLITIGVSFFTKPHPPEKLVGLVHGLSELPVETGTPWYERPVTLGVIVAIVLLGLNFWFR